MGAKYFSRNFRLYLAFFDHLRLMATFRAPNVTALSFYRYFLKPSMLFADKLIDRHYTLLGEHLLSATSPIIIFGHQRGLL